MKNLLRLAFVVIGGTGLIVILLNKANYIKPYRVEGITTALDFFIGWPLIIASAASMAWVVIHYFTFPPINDRLSVSGKATLIILLGYVLYIAYAYYQTHIVH